MAAGDTKVTRPFLDRQHDGTAVVDFNTDTIKMMLVKAAHTPSYTDDLFAASLTANQVSITGATAYGDGGLTMSTVSMTSSGSFAIFKAGTMSIAQDASGFSTARNGAIYKLAAGGTLAESPIIAWVELASDRSNTAGPLQIYWTNNKVIKWQY